MTFLPYEKYIFDLTYAHFFVQKENGDFHFDCPKVGDF